MQRHTSSASASGTGRILRGSGGGWFKRATATWCDAIGGLEGVRVLIDEGRVHYATWGLGRSSLRHFMGRRSLGEVARLARQGIRNRHPEGTRWQRAGTFAIDAQGIVRWRHVPEHAGDLPDLGEAARYAGA